MFLQSKLQCVLIFNHVICTSDAKLSCLKWNPAYSEVLVVAVSTGVVCLVTVKDDVSVPVTKAGIPVNTGTHMHAHTDTHTHEYRKKSES